MRQYNSPILKDKYNWQAREFKRTKNMSTRQYAEYIKQRVDQIITQAGYKKKSLGTGVFKLAA